MAHKRRRAAAGGAVAYEVNYSCRFNDDDAAHLARTVSGSPTDTDVLMLNCWAKLGAVAATEKDLLQTYDDANNRMGIGFNTATNYFVVQEKVGGSTKCDYTWPDILHRDPHAWYNVHVELNSSAGAGANVRVWINNVELTGETIGTEKTSSEAWLVNTAGSLNFIGRGSNGNNNYMEGYIAQHIVVDGTVDGGPSNFIEVDDNGVVRPIEPVVAAYGDDGHYLDFAIVESSGDGAGTDVSGKTNHWAASGIADNDRVVDTPTNNYMTWTPLMNGTLATLSNGNLQTDHTTADVPAYSSWSFTSGKWYLEVEATTFVAGDWIGVCSGTYPGAKTGLQDDIAADAQCWVYKPSTGYKSNGNGDPGVSYGSGASAGNKIGIAIDMDQGAGSNKIWISVEGTFEASGDPDGDANAMYTNLPGEVFIVQQSRSSSAGKFIMNCGQLGALATTNLTGFNAPSTTTTPVPDATDFSKEAVLTNDTEANIAATLATARGTYTSYVDLLKNRDSSEDWIWRFSHDADNEHIQGTTSTHQETSDLIGSAAWMGMSIKVDGEYKVRAGSVVHGSGDTTVSYTSVGTARCMILLFRREGGIEVPWFHPDLTSGDLLELTSANDEATDAFIKTVADDSFIIDDGEAEDTYDYLVLPESALISLFSFEGNANANNALIPFSGTPMWFAAKDMDATGTHSNAYNTITDPINPANEPFLHSSNSAEGGSNTGDIDIGSNFVKIRTTGSDIGQATTKVGFAIMDVPFGGHGGAFGGGVSPATAR